MYVPYIIREPVSVKLTLFQPLFRKKETILSIFKQRLIDNFIGILRRGLEASRSMSLYKEFNQNFELSLYLSKIHKKHRNSLAKLCLSSHSLMIESGRHNGIERENRIGPICNTNDLEDEFHFIFICPIYNELRTMYIKRYYMNNPSMYKFIELLNSSG